MLPLGIEPRVLASLAVPTADELQRVQKIWRATITARVVPYWRRREQHDAAQLERLAHELVLERYEDGAQQSRPCGLLLRIDGRWRLQVHERLLDYWATVFGTQGDASREQRQALGVMELMLRHGFEHMLYPKRPQHEVIASDGRFAMQLRHAEPSHYRMLRAALGGEMPGLCAQEYCLFFDRLERDEPADGVIARIVRQQVELLAQVPDALLEAAFLSSDTSIRERLVDECFRRSSSIEVPLVGRAEWMRRTLRLFACQWGEDVTAARALFEDFDTRWGVAALFHQLQGSGWNRAGRTLDELFGALVEQLPKPRRDSVSPAAVVGLAESQPRPVSLKERIEQAKADPLFPRPVIDIMENNRAAAASTVSGAKYSELIETLLSIPWGKLHKIDISPQQFLEGLERSHYGLERPKETVADFFTNLIWRYRRFDPSRPHTWHRNGSTVLLVGPPGVGKTSLAISVAQNLGIPYHKISLGGMRDDADLRGHGFTYEGSKPGAVVQGLMKMGVMNGMFIMDEADKTERLAVATLLEILDPEQNHLFHDKYTGSTVDIDLSNCHFVLTANSTDTVPAAVLNRCEVIHLDRYSIEEKVAIACQHLIPRLRARYDIPVDQLDFDPHEQADLLRYIVTTHSREPGVRLLERAFRTLFLRIQRKHLLQGGQTVRITRRLAAQYLEDPGPARRINPEDRVGDMLAIGVNVELGLGAIMPIQATRISLGPQAPRQTHLSMVHATGNIEKVMDESRRVATTGILHCAQQLGLRPERLDQPIHLHFMGAASKKDGPSAGGAIALALASLLSDTPIRRDVAMSGEIDTQGRITAVGGLRAKVETAYNAGCRTILIPMDNLRGEGGIERFPEPLKKELQILTYEQWKGPHAPFDYRRHVLQVVAVQHVTQAADVAFIRANELKSVDEALASHGRRMVARLATHADGPRLVMIVKEPAELDPSVLHNSFCPACPGCELLVSPEALVELRARIPAPRAARVQPFNPASDCLSSVARASLDRFQHTAGARAGLALVAPYWVLVQSGVREAVRAGELEGRNVRLMANNYSVQGLELTSSKALLHRVGCYLARMPDEVVRSCPFVAEKDGIMMIDLSFIPEKYRLDEARAEAILQQALNRWLAELEPARAA